MRAVETEDVLWMLRLLRRREVARYGVWSTKNGCDERREGGAPGLLLDGDGLGPYELYEV